MHKFYTELDLPPLPSYIVDSVDLNMTPCVPKPDSRMELGIFAQRHLKNWHGFDYKAAANIRTQHVEFDQWVRKNITNDFEDAGVNWTIITERPNNLDQVSTGAHTDTSRDFTLIYLLKTGGNHVQTVFYQETDQPLLRRPRTHGEDLTKLTKLVQIEIPLHTWFIIDSRILHSVENLTHSRVAFQVGLYVNHWQESWPTFPDPGYRNPITHAF